MLLHSGGKIGTSTIENDHDFEVVKAAMLKKKQESYTISIEFDVDVMDGFCVRKRVCYGFNMNTGQAIDLARQLILQVDQPNEREEMLSVTGT